jgi:hypothetical protein
MNKFFDKMTVTEAEQVQSLTRLVYELRENCNALLSQYSVIDGQALLEKIATGQVAEHPAYEHYLSVNILDQTKESIREDLKNYLKGVAI